MSVSLSEIAWSARPVALEPGAQLVVGADGHPMLTMNGRYVILGRQGLALLARLDGRATAAELVRQLSVECCASEVDVAPYLRRFLLELASAEMLAGQRVDRVGWWFHNKELPFFRWRLTGRVDVVAVVLARWVMLVPGTWQTAGVIAGLVFGVGAFALAAHHGLSLSHDPWIVLLGVVLALCQGVGHELAHAVTGACFGLRAREAGVSLWMGVLPGAYVEIPDVYRLEARLPRVLIPLAGPIHDTACLGIWSTAACLGSGSLAEVASWAALWGGIRLADQLNPLRPTDGLRALEAGTGRVAFRSRGLELAVAALLRRPAPSWSFALSEVERALHWAYGMISLGYAVAMPIILVAGIAWVVSGGGR